MKNEKFSGIFAFLKKNAMLLILGVGCVAVMLYAGSALQEKKAESVKIEEKNDDDSFIELTEKKLKQLLENTSGVGKCEVMITLQSSSEYVYAQEEKSGNYGVDSSYKTVTDGKSETPVVIKKQTPSIAGVAVVCDGGGSSSIKNEVTELICKILSIDGAKVSVNKRK